MKVSRRLCEGRGDAHGVQDTLEHRVNDIREKKDQKEVAYVLEQTDNYEMITFSCIRSEDSDQDLELLTGFLPG